MGAFLKISHEETWKTYRKLSHMYRTAHITPDEGCLKTSTSNQKLVFNMTDITFSMSYGLSLEESMVHFG
jgi:hypothetical protein